MENKIIMVMVIIGLVLLGTIGIMTFILVTREPVPVQIKKEDTVKAFVEEPPPLEEEALLKATKVVGERLRVFDVEEKQDGILAAISAELSPEMSVSEQKIVIETVVDTALTAWKDQVIRDTLIEMYGEYSSEDYEAIDRKTHIDKLKAFVSRFEMEVLGIE